MDILTSNATWIIAGIILLAAIVLGWRDFLRLSWYRIWAISGVCFSESIRRRVLWITPVAIIGVMIVAQLTRPFDEQDAIRQTTKFALFTTGLVVVIVGILLASTSLPKEIENRVIFTVVTKPTTRLEIVLGKTIGFARVSATILLIMGLFTAIYLQARSWNLRREIVAKLDAGAVDPLSRPTLEHYKSYGLLNAKRYAEKPDLQFYARLPELKQVRRYAQAGQENQIIVPFDLTPDMFGNVEQGFRMAVLMKIGYERNFDYVAPKPESPTTQPGEVKLPSWLTSTTQPAKPNDPQVAVGFLDSEETTLVGSPEMHGGQLIHLPADQSQSVFIELTPDNISKLQKASLSPATRRVYFGVTGAAGDWFYSADESPAVLITGQATGNGQIANQVKILPATDSRTGQPSLPIFRGGYSRYGQELKGTDKNNSLAVFHYRNAVTDDAENANFEMKLGIDRSGSEGSEEEDTVTKVGLQIRNTQSGQLTAEQIITPETNRTAYFSFPASATRGGEFDLIVRVLTPEHTIGLKTTNTQMVVDTGSFYGNLTKSLLIFWLLSVLVVAVAICCSTFLSWPIAVVLCIVILLGKWGVDQLGDATKPGIGAQVATDFGFRDPRQAKVVSESVETLTKFLNVLSAVLPDISQFPATEDIERGVSIPKDKLMESAKEALAFGIPLLLLGYVVLKNKEVAP
jgi:hypothetical protein